MTLNPWIRICTVLALLGGVANPVHAHGTPEMDAVRLTLLTWSNSMMGGDAEGMASALHTDYVPSAGLSPDFHMEVIRQGLVLLDGGMNLRQAFFEKQSNGDIQVSRVIFETNMSMKLVWTVTLRREDDGWKIVSVTDTATTDTAATDPVATDPAEHPKLYPARVRIREAGTRQLIAARIHAEGEDGVYWPPEGHMKDVPIGWRQDVGGDVVIDGKTYAYVEPTSVLPLPEGSFVLEVARGLEYEPQTVRFDVQPRMVPTVEIQLRRWVHMAAEGWYSGDTHVHFLTPSSALLESRGEDLNVINVLATQWGELITDTEHFTGAPSVISAPKHVVYYNEESRHGFLGHTALLGLKQLVYPLSWGSPHEGVPGAYDYPPMALQADRTHEQGGHVAWAHFPFPSGELAVDVALGKVDSIDLMTWGDAFAETGLMPGVPGAAMIWYRFLNCGFHLPTSAGTDKMWNNQLVGSPRVYAKIPGPFTYENWLASIRAGRSFVTTGPMIDLKVTSQRSGQPSRGKGLGETVEAHSGEKLTATVRVRSRRPVDHVEIVHGGEVVVRRENQHKTLDWTIEAEIEVTQGSWLAARTRAAGALPYQGTPLQTGLAGIPYFAHTSPIYLEVDGQGARSPEDAAFFAAWCDQAIAWAQTQARFRSEEERQEVVALFEQAKAVYTAQMTPASEK